MLTGMRSGLNQRRDAMLIFTVLTVFILVELGLYGIWGFTPEE
jgi:hypothetical protein